jgi:hypothetical protein
MRARTTSLFASAARELRRADAATLAAEAAIKWRRLKVDMDRFHEET